MRSTSQELDWCAQAVASEVAYSIARGGVATDFGGFIHLLNLSVPWCGDYNRAVGVRSRSASEFEELVAAVARLHKKHHRDTPDHFDMHPATDDPIPFASDLPEEKYLVVPDFFMIKFVSMTETPSEFTWRRVTPTEYVSWWLEQQRLTDYYDPEMCELDSLLEERFVEIFVPYFLERGGELVAWVHCAELEHCLKLFGVEVAQQHRGKGFGRALLQTVEAEAATRSVPYVLIRCRGDVKPFYEACGYKECCRGAMVRTVRRTSESAAT